MATRNPKGYIFWFESLFIEDVSTISLRDYYKTKSEIRAEVETLPQAVFYELSQPLQRTVQLIKRARDIYFEHDKDNATSSVILTTIAGRYYNSETSIMGTMSGIIQRIKIDLQNNTYPNILTIYNPADDHLPETEREKLSDKWEDGAKGQKRYQEFRKFIFWLSESWEAFIQLERDPHEALVSLFGKSPTNTADSQYRKHFNGLEKLGLVGISTTSHGLTSDRSLSDFKNYPTNTNHGDVF